jgi:hypothetical protein
MEPTIFRPFESLQFAELKRHTGEIRRAFDYPGIPYHDADEENKDNKFNRWQWHNLPLLVEMHHDHEFIKTVSDMLGVKVKPSYVFLSMYGPDGVCPLHVDRPQCQFTVDLAIEQDAIWPIYINDKPIALQEGEAVLYSGTGDPHFRKPMSEDSLATYCTLAFFHFVPTTWMGRLS